eukprot:403343339
MIESNYQQQSQNRQASISQNIHQTSNQPQIQNQYPSQNPHQNMIFQYKQGQSNMPIQNNQQQFQQQIHYQKENFGVSDTPSQIVDAEHDLSSQIIQFQPENQSSLYRMQDSQSFREFDPSNRQYYRDSYRQSTRQMDQNYLVQQQQQQKINHQMQEGKQYFSTRNGGSEDQEIQKINDESEDSDNEYELCFVVEDVEFLTYKNGFIIHSQYFRDLLSTVNDQQIRILLPLWATANAFRIVLDFVNVGDISSDIDLQTIQNVLWLADFFQIHQLQRLCIDNFIVPRLTNQNVLTFLEDAFQKLSSCQEQQAKFQQDKSELMLGQSQQFEEQFQQYIWAEDIWYEFFNQCLDISAQNIDFIIKCKEKELLNLPDSVVEEIIERALKIQCRTEDNDLVKFMMKMKKVGSPFDLLDLEKTRIIQTYERLVQQKSAMSDPLLTASQNSQIKPLLTWKLSNLNMKQNFYKESDPFPVDGTSWVLFIQKMNDKEFMIGIKFQSLFDNDYDSYDRVKNSMKNVYSKYSLLSLLNWSKGVRLNSSQKVFEEKEILELLKQINWPYVSFDKLMELFKTFPILRQNIHIKSIFNNEFRTRATKKQNEVSVPPRMSYDSVMIETLFDYKYFLDKVVDYMFRAFDQQQSSQALISPNQNITRNEQTQSNSQLNYKSMNKQFLEEQYFTKLKELTEVKDELHRRQLSAQKFPVAITTTDINLSQMHHPDILSPSTANGDEANFQDINMKNQAAQNGSLQQNSSQKLQKRRQSNSSKFSGNKSRTRPEHQTQQYLSSSAQKQSMNQILTHNNNGNLIDHKQRTTQDYLTKNLNQQQSQESLNLRQQNQMLKNQTAIQDNINNDKSQKIMMRTISSQQQAQSNQNKTLKLSSNKGPIKAHQLVKSNEFSPPKDSPRNQQNQQSNLKHYQKAGVSQQVTEKKPLNSSSPSQQSLSFQNFVHPPHTNLSQQNAYLNFSGKQNNLKPLNQSSNQNLLNTSGGGHHNNQLNKSSNKGSQRYLKMQQEDSYYEEDQQQQIEHLEISNRKNDDKFEIVYNHNQDLELQGNDQEQYQKIFKHSNTRSQKYLGNLEEEEKLQLSSVDRLNNNENKQQNMLDNPIQNGYKNKQIMELEDHTQFQIQMANNQNLQNSQNLHIDQEQEFIQGTIGYQVNLDDDMSSQRFSLNEQDQQQDNQQEEYGEEYGNEDDQQIDNQQNYNDDNDDNYGSENDDANEQENDEDEENNDAEAGLQVNSYTNSHEQKQDHQFQQNQYFKNTGLDKSDMSNSQQYLSDEVTAQPNQVYNQERQSLMKSVNSNQFLHQNLNQNSKQVQKTVQITYQQTAQNSKLSKIQNNQIYQQSAVINQGRSLGNSATSAFNNNQQQNHQNNTRINLQHHMNMKQSNSHSKVANTRMGQDYNQKHEGSGESQSQKKFLNNLNNSFAK